MAKINEVFDGKTGIAVGWGAQQEFPSLDFPEVPLEVDLVVAPKGTDESCPTTCRYGMIEKGSSLYKWPMMNDHSYSQNYSNCSSNSSTFRIIASMLAKASYQLFTN